MTHDDPVTHEKPVYPQPAAASCLTYDEAGEALGRVSRRTIARLVDRGELSRIRVGRRVRTTPPRSRLSSSVEELRERRPPRRRRGGGTGRSTTMAFRSDGIRRIRLTKPVLRELRLALLAHSSHELDLVEQRFDNGDVVIRLGRPDRPASGERILGAYNTRKRAQ